MKNLKLSYLVLALALVVFGCNEPNSGKIFELSFLELDAATTASGSRTYTYLRENNGVNKPSGFKVNLASQPLSQDIQVGFEILTSSTAIQNVHYTVANQVVVIPAGQNIAELPIEIIADAINAGEQLSINIKITGDANVKAMTGLDEASHIIQISCPPNIPEGGSWTGVTTEGVFGVFGNEPNVTINYLGGTGYEVSHIGAGYFVNFGGPTAISSGQFADICDAISITVDGSVRYGSITTSPANGGGTFDPNTNTITLPWYNPTNDIEEISVFTRN